MTKPTITKTQLQKARWIGKSIIIKNKVNGKTVETEWLFSDVHIACGTPINKSTVWKRVLADQKRPKKERRDIYTLFFGKPDRFFGDPPKQEEPYINDLIRVVVTSKWVGDTFNWVWPADAHVQDYRERV